MYVPVFVIVMDFYSLVIGLMVKLLFAFTSDISFYILHIGNTSKNQLKNSKSLPKFLRNSIQKMLASMKLYTRAVW
jgi:hypothetical protein